MIPMRTPSTSSPPASSPPASPLATSARPVSPLRAARLPLMLLALLAALLLIPLSGEIYYVKFATRMAIYGLIALGLDLVVGYVGLISLGHAAFVGIGAYATGILAAHGVDLALVVWPAAMLAAGAAALAIGALSLRTGGIHFILLTLAFAQMIYYLAQSLRAYGGDDGFALALPTRLAGGLDGGDPVVFFYAVVALLLLVLFLAKRLVDSRFGQVIQGSRDNERRLSAIGIAPFPHKLVAFTVSGAVCGLGGALLANLTGYITPNLLGWALSGELLMMVILGSVGTLVGPVLGGALFIVFEQLLSDRTDHWMLIFGVILVVRVLALRDGIYGLLRNGLQPTGERP